jgi:thiol-disulfide isomerase/thioredoxin
MRTFRHLTAAVLAAGVLIAAVPGARAAEIVPFSQPAFEAAQKQGKPILVQITASWCPVCAKQKPILSHLLAEPRFKDMVVYNIDFDAQKDLVREMGAQKQSTLIVFTGSSEKGRSTGETDPAAIEGLLARSAG